MNIILPLRMMMCFKFYDTKMLLLFKSTRHDHELLPSDNAPQQVISNTLRRKGLKQGLIKESITIHLCKTVLQNNCFVSS